MFQRAFKQAGIKKKFNPHIFRHSRALWLAQNNWNNVLANKMFGWGMNSNMYNYYVSLATDDLKDMMMESYGLPNNKEKKMEKRKPKECPRCEAVNEKSSRFCFKCGYILDMNTAKELMKKQELEKDLQGELFQKIPETADKTKNIQELMFDVLKKDKKLIDKLKEIAS